MQSEIESIGALSAPITDQLNADDLIAGPRIFTIKRITRGKGTGAGKGDQPINIHLAEHAHPWRPCKTVRRLLMDAWGEKPGQWPDGAQIELYRDAEVRFGGETVGGIRVRAMSHLERPTIEHIATATRGQRVMWTIRRLDTRNSPAKPPPNIQASIDTAVRLFGDLGVGLDELEMTLGQERAKWGADELAQLRADYAKRKSRSTVIQPTDEAAHDEPAALTNRDKLEALAEEAGQTLAAYLGSRGWTKPLDVLTEADAEALLNRGAK